MRVVAAVDGYPLRLDAPGAVLFIRSAARRDWVEQLPDGITVAVAANSKAVRVEGLTLAGDHDTVLADARRTANQALDLMAVQSLGAYSLTGIEWPMIAWTPSSTGVTLQTRTFVHSALEMRIGGPPQPTPKPWHESMRYFRMSQTTSDLYDAFRNPYLALESLLNTIAPIGVHPSSRPAERERDWLRRALCEADRLLSAKGQIDTLSIHAPPAVAGPVVDRIIDDLYTQIRTAVFHAKKGHVVLLPQDDPERERVADALQRYVGLYTRVAEVVLQTRFFQTGIGLIVVERIGELLARQTVGLSDRAFVGLKDYDEAAASALIPLATRRAPEYDGSFRAAVLGTAEVSLLPPDLLIRSVGMRMEDGKPATVESFGAALGLNGVGTIEALVTFRGSGAGARTLYDT